jgi:heme/copper-type cytochrome/quinol oxidase subunit 4
MTPVERQLSIAWLVMVALTLLSFAVAEGHIGHRLVLAAIFTVAAIKGQIVASRFMEVGHALPHWRALYRIWIVAIAIVLAGGHLV